MKNPAAKITVRLGNVMMNDAALEDPTSLHMSSEQQLSSHFLMVAPTLSQFVVFKTPPSPGRTKTAQNTK